MIELPKFAPRSQVGYLDASIDEGQKVLLSNGDEVNWSPPPPVAVVPDWSQIKSIRHYFNRTSRQTYPAWLYHPTEGGRIVKDAKEAKELGVTYRQSTYEEKGRYGIDFVWDWEEGSLWRPTPYEGKRSDGRRAYDPSRAEQGKVYVATAPNPIVAQNALIEALIPQVAKAVAQALQSNGPSAPASVDPDQWKQFLEFQAWQKSAEAVKVVAEAAAEDETRGGSALANALTPEQDRALWEEEAARKGIKADGRWSLERLRKEVEAAPEPKAA